MRILDQYGNVLQREQADLEAGYLRNDRVFVKHHEAVSAVEEIGHYETLQTYTNGGKDVRWIVDVPGVPAKAAWEEYEEILRYVPYTAEALAERAADRQRAERMEALLAGGALRADLQELYEALNMLLSGVTE